MNIQNLTSKKTKVNLTISETIDKYQTKDEAIKILALSAVLCSASPNSLNVLFEEKLTKEEYILINRARDIVINQVNNIIYELGHKKLKNITNQSFK